MLYVRQIFFLGLAASLTWGSLSGPSNMALAQARLTHSHPASVNLPQCFMQTSQGELRDLSHLCKRPVSILNLDQPSQSEATPDSSVNAEGDTVAEDGTQQKGGTDPKITWGPPCEYQEASFRQNVLTVERRATQDYVLCVPIE